MVPLKVLLDLMLAAAERPELVIAHLEAPSTRNGRAMAMALRVTTGADTREGRIKSGIR
jgi:hypothetical protein